MTNKRIAAPERDHRISEWFLALATIRSTGTPCDPHVEVRRILEGDHGGLEETDPLVSIIIKGTDPDAEEQYVDDLRASELDSLAEQLQQAIEYGRALKVLPPPVDWTTRLEWWNKKRSLPDSAHKESKAEVE